jgi:hypothetical protein
VRATAPIGGLLSQHATKASVSGGANPAQCQMIGRPTTTAGINPNLQADRQWAKLLDNTFVGPLSTPSYSRQYHVNDTSTTSNGTDTVTASSSISIDKAGTGVGGVPPAAPSPPPGAPPAPGPSKAKAKTAALADLKWSLGFGAHTCGLLVTGVGLTAGGLLTSNVVAAGSGAVMTALGSPTLPICQKLGNRIQADLNVISDPPLAGIHRLARVAHVGGAPLPSCGRTSGAGRTACEQVRAAAENVVMASHG